MLPLCDLCPEKPCRRGDLSRAPRFCPSLRRELVEAAKRRILEDEEVRRLMLAAAWVEGRGYLEWPRVREVAEFALRLGARRVGLAFCVGLSEEARAVAEYLRGRGLEVASVCCKCGAIEKGEIGVPEEWRIRPGEFEATCNPVLQAMVLEEAGCELILSLGLCVGHDAVLSMVSRVPVVQVAVKDRVTGHNPLAAIYSQYVRRRLDPRWDHAREAHRRSEGGSEGAEGEPRGAGGGGDPR